MKNQPTLSRRDVHRALLTTALAMIGRPSVAMARRVVPLFNFAIAGGYYHGLKAALGRIGPGTRLDLVREPHNVYDANAIAVYLDSLKLGFIPRAANSPVAHLLDRGERVMADVVRMLDTRRSSEILDDLVFTGFISGDPMIRLTVEEPIDGFIA